MGTIIGEDCLRKKREEKRETEDQRIRRLIKRKFGGHTDYALIMNLLDEYGPATMAGVIRSTYDSAFAY